MPHESVAQFMTVLSGKIMSASEIEALLARVLT